MRILKSHVCCPNVLKASFLDLASWNVDSRSTYYMVRLELNKKALWVGAKLLRGPTNSQRPRVNSHAVF